MAYPHTSELGFPLENVGKPIFGFKETASYGGVFWGKHLGDDYSVRSGVSVQAIGRGRVVYSALHPGSKKHGNWGHIVIIAHKHPRTLKVFFSLYGHLGERYFKKGDRVEKGFKIGVIGKGYTSENGYWASHLHFAIYTGAWKGVVLPGYWKKGSKRTKVSDWKDPSLFIDKYSL